MGYGTVHVYVVGPDGHMLAGIGIVRALQNDNLYKFLQQIVTQMKLTAGPTLVKQRPQSVAPASDANSLILHVTARGSNEGSWREFPAEDWIVLPSSEWTKVLPQSGAAVGATWELEPAVAQKLLTHFHPQIEESNTRIDRNKFEKASLTGKVISVQAGVVRARLDGALQMLRAFYPWHQDLGLIRATLVGYVDFSQDLKHIDSLELVTDKASWNDEDFSAVLRSGYETKARR